MRDIRIQFGGDQGTRFVFNETVEGKKLYVQKYLINTVTAKETDHFFKDRGTDLLKDAIGGSLVDTQQSKHVGNFAALDTIYFCSYEEVPECFSDMSYIMEYALQPIYYNNTKQLLYFNATFVFRDGENTADKFNINFTSE